MSVNTFEASELTITVRDDDDSFDGLLNVVPVKRRVYLRTEGDGVSLDPEGARRLAAILTAWADNPGPRVVSLLRAAGLSD